MLRSLSLFAIAVALPVISECPPTWGGGSSAALASTVLQPVSAQTITIVDPVGDAVLNAPAFQDIVFCQMTKTASGDFELQMEMAGPLPAAPPLPPPGVSVIWWTWALDLDPTAFPKGTPFSPGAKKRGEFLVSVTWDGTAFAGTAIDRRPLLTGGEAIVTPVSFSINGAIVEAVLPSTLIGDVPSSFGWHLHAMDWSGPIGSTGYLTVDDADFDP